MNSASIQKSVTERVASRLKRQRDEFAMRQGRLIDLAKRQWAALAYLGLDLEAVDDLHGEARSLLVLRIDRLLERERLKGLNRHWSYDLNRHIALKQLRDELGAVDHGGTV